MVNQVSNRTKSASNRSVFLLSTESMRNVEAGDGASVGRSLCSRRGVEGEHQSRR